MMKFNHIQRLLDLIIVIFLLPWLRSNTFGWHTPILILFYNDSRNGKTLKCISLGHSIEVPQINQPMS